MNRVTIRDLLVTRMEAQWSHKATTPIFYKRQQDSIDLEELTTLGVDKFIKFTVLFDTNEQISLGKAPLSRLYGNLDITLFAKEGSSERDQQVLLDELTEIFKFQALGSGLHTRVPTPGRSEEHDGWCSQTLRVPFFADSNT